MSATQDQAPDAGQGYALAFNEGVRALSEQQAVIDSFRTRSGLLLSGAAIATSFLGRQRSIAAPLSSLGLQSRCSRRLALLSSRFCGPRNDWEYAIRPELLIANYIEHPKPLPLEQIHRDLALHMDRSYLRNRGQLLRLVWLFRAASILLTIEVVAWVVDLVVQA